MGWKRVETPNAVYILNLETHLFSDRSGFEQPHDATAWEHRSRKGGLSGIKFAEYVGADAFLVDVRSTALGNARDLLEILPYGVSSGVLMGLGFKKFAGLLRSKKLNRREWLRELGKGAGMLLFPMGMFSFLSLAFPGEIKRRSKISEPSLAVQEFFGGVGIKLRNALAAEKLETVVAPMVSKKLGRKPVIVVNFGASHAGIEDMLKNRKSRHKIIRKYAKSLRHYFKEESIQHIYEIKIKRGRPWFKPIEAPLQPLVEKPTPITRREFFHRFRPRVG